VSCRAAALVLGLLAGSLAAQDPCCDPWNDLGQSLAGARGAPHLQPMGSLADATQFVLDVQGAAPSAAGLLFAGFSDLSKGFKGGVLVPAPNLLMPVITDSAGSVALTGLWPAGVPQGSTFYAQFWVFDGSAPMLFAASNAELGVTPPPPPVGQFPADWINGSQCDVDPPIQVQQYGENTWILRQNKCTKVYGNFMFLFFGHDRAILFDTGAGGIPIFDTVESILHDWLVEHGKASIPLIVAHTHAHADHVAGDPDFADQPGVTLVGTTPAEVQAFFGFKDWPTDVAHFDLGGRTLDLVATPGHEASHIAIYDHQTALLVTGDMLYPGYIFIPHAVSQGNFAQFQASAQRLVDFVADKPIAWIFGCHIEMKDTPFEAYPHWTAAQPDEHDPQLTRAQLLELNAAVQAMSPPIYEIHADFIIDPSD
jgi:glyoxylase-like metal-dependent hydrolase (beta-lactamase superfamily II)